MKELCPESLKKHLQNSKTTYPKEQEMNDPARRLMKRENKHPMDIQNYASSSVTGEM